LTQEQKASHPKLSRDYPYNEMTEKYWMNDSDSLYKEEKRFDWFRPNIVGGKSIMWGRQTYRLSDLDFEANLKDGIAVDWPIRYSDIAPWYSYVEKHVGISGEGPRIATFTGFGVFKADGHVLCGKGSSQENRKEFPG
jgi:choline dehydrogenase-like flavoprotein